MTQLGKPYGHGLWGDPDLPPGLTGQAGQAGQDSADVFDCVTFVEATLAVARCAWQGTRQPACFEAELAGLRYRDALGEEPGQRLHYFEAWLEGNAAGHRLQLLDKARGTATMRGMFFYVSTHPGAFPGMGAAPGFAEMVRQEAWLSARDWPVVPSAEVPALAPTLEAGDIVAVVGSKKGLLVTHTGFVFVDGDGRRRLLHASSTHGRVVLSVDDLGSYMTRRVERRGVMLARPLPPGR